MIDRETQALLNAIRDFEDTHQKMAGFDQIRSKLDAVTTAIHDSAPAQQSPGQQAAGRPPVPPPSGSPGQQAAQQAGAPPRGGPPPSPGQQAAGGAMPGGLIEYLKRKKQMAGH